MKFKLFSATSQRATSRRPTSRRPRSRNAFEIAIFTTLTSERDPIELALDESYEKGGFTYGKAPGDQNIYRTGRFGSSHVVIVYLPEGGNTHSAAAAMFTNQSFPNIRLTLVVGCCEVNRHTYGKTPENIALGDVLISTQVVHITDAHQRNWRMVSKRPEDVLGRPPVEVRSFLAFIQDTGKRRLLGKRTVTYGEATQKGLGRTTNTQQPSLRFGRLGSSEHTLGNWRERNQFACENEIIGFETQGAGTWDFLPTIVVKGAANYVDDPQNKAWQRHSAMNAAACARAMVEEWTRTVG
ncbi:hypothetical protein BJX76DRAFT_358786 [Aspergillus varians]